MFLKQLMISSPSLGIIRQIDFHIGLNLIVDHTPSNTHLETGNNVGKTTVLALIDFCLGGGVEMIYRDPETKKDLEYVKNFLEDYEVLISLILKEDLSDPKSREVRIERNFLKRKFKIMSVNGKNLPGNQDKDFKEQLDTAILGERNVEKPTFRQLIAHYIRKNDQSINNTLKFLDSHTTAIEYETLFLYMFGMPVQSNRSELNARLKAETEFKARLERYSNRTELELQLQMVQDNIKELNERKARLNINKNYEQDLDHLNKMKLQISRISTHISEDQIRRDLILETKQELEKDFSLVDTAALKEIYQTAKANIGNLQKTFEEMLNYHNRMIAERIRFLTQDLPALEEQIYANQQQLSQMLKQEKKLVKIIAVSDTFKDLEEIMDQLNNTYHRAGELETAIEQIKKTESKIQKLEDDININDSSEGAYSNAFNDRLKNQLTTFNRYFSRIAQDIYGEQYGIAFDIKEDKKSKMPYYHFTSFNANTSSGKKQGEIVCFDIAYILFARAMALPTLDFLINDKKELMHGNQLIKTKECIEEKNIQALFSILSDKLPQELNSNEYIALNLSEQSKLFRIEELTSPPELINHFPVNGGSVLRFKPPKNLSA